MICVALDLVCVCVSCVKESWGKIQDYTEEGGRGVRIRMTEALWRSFDGLAVPQAP